jgi:hypothetical protein
MSIQCHDHEEPEKMAPVSTTSGDKYWNVHSYLSKAGLCATIGNRPDQSLKMVDDTQDVVGEFFDREIKHDHTKPIWSFTSCDTSPPVDLCTVIFIRRCSSESVSAFSVNSCLHFVRLPIQARGRRSFSLRRAISLCCLVRAISCLLGPSQTNYA